MAHIVKILIVTDGSGGFLKSTPSIQNQDFHLGEFIEVLESTSWVGFQIDIVKAHRENVTATQRGADLVNFDFATHDLSQYDEIFLFPIRRDDDALNVPAGSPARSSNATDAEIAAIARFMDAGGGVFATGDHEDLGAGLCRRLPRVRNMRRWYWQAAGPNGEPVAPPGSAGISDSLLMHRHDTLQAGRDRIPADPTANFQFDDQSDNIAQPLTVPYFESSSLGAFARKRYPHPLLCSPDGIVRVLPDHAHEGQCEVPARLDLSVTAGTYNEEEYPSLPGSSTRLAPVVVATATVIGGHPTTNPNKPAVVGKTFGVIGAYDGHRVSRNDQRLGRVVVDATWHHFFNVNLIGDSTSPEPAKRQGFRAALPSGQTDHYRMIKHYFRNLVYWLIPHHRGARIFLKTLFEMARAPQFYEVANFKHLVLERHDITYYLAMARLADAYFKQARGACYALQFFPIVIEERLPRIPRIWDVLVPEMDPWAQRPRREREPLLRAGLDPEIASGALWGSVVVAAARAAIEQPQEKDGDEEHAIRAFEGFLPVTVGRALRELHGALDEQHAETQRALALLKEAGELTKRAD